MAIQSAHCQTSFHENLEKSAKKQQDFMRAMMTNAYGVMACVFNPRLETSVYDSDDQDYHYPVVPDYEGKLLIQGLSDVIRYAGEDQWSMPEVTLFWSEPNIFTIKENAKIVVHQNDQKVSLRAKNIRRLMGAFVELVQVIELIPFN